MPSLPAGESAAGKVLLRVRGAPSAAQPFARSLHAALSGGEDTGGPQRARRRAKAGHRHVRGPRELDGAARRPRPGGRASAYRRRARADDGGGASLRGNREPDHGRRDHGAVRRARRTRGPRAAGLLRGAAHAGIRQAFLRRNAGDRRDRDAHSRGNQFWRRAGPLDRGRPAHGLHRHRRDDAPRRESGADGRAGDHLRYCGAGAAGRWLRPGASPRTACHQGPCPCGRAVRNHWYGAATHPLPGGDAARPEPFCRPSA